MKTRDLTQDQARMLFSCRDGFLYWNSSPAKAVRAGSRAGHVRSDGYATVSIKGVSYKIHQVVFLMHHGYIPGTIDHKNGRRGDNRIENLRDVTHAKNCETRGRRIDNQSGVTGVYFDAEGGKWRASIQSSGKSYLLGRFRDFWDAVVARRNAEHKHFGELTPSMRDALSTIL